MREATWPAEVADAATTLGWLRRTAPTTAVINQAFRLITPTSRFLRATQTSPPLEGPAQAFGRVPPTRPGGWAVTGVKAARRRGGGQIRQPPLPDAGVR